MIIMRKDVLKIFSVPNINKMYQISLNQLIGNGYNNLFSIGINGNILLQINPSELKLITVFAENQKNVLKCGGKIFAKLESPQVAVCKSGFFSSLFNDSGSNKVDEDVLFGSQKDSDKREKVLSKFDKSVSPHSDLQCGGTSSSNEFTKLKISLIERTKQLESTENVASEMTSAAQDYSKLTKKLLAKSKNKKWKSGDDKTETSGESKKIKNIVINQTIKLRDNSNRNKCLETFTFTRLRNSLDDSKKNENNTYLDSVNESTNSTISTYQNYHDRGKVSNVIWSSCCENIEAHRRISNVSSGNSFDSVYFNQTNEINQQSLSKTYNINMSKENKSSLGNSTITAPKYFNKNNYTGIYRFEPFSTVSNASTYTIKSKYDNSIQSSSKDMTYVISGSNVTLKHNNFKKFPKNIHKRRNNSCISRPGKLLCEMSCQRFHTISICVNISKSVTNNNLQKLSLQFHQTPRLSNRKTFQKASKIFEINKKIQKSLNKNGKKKFNNFEYNVNYGNNIPLNITMDHIKKSNSAMYTFTCLEDLVPENTECKKGDDADDIKCHSESNFQKLELSSHFPRYSFEKATYTSKDESKNFIVASQRYVVVMVGLPARGKSYISYRLARHMNWIGINTRVFNVGKYRRAYVVFNDHNFFDPYNISTMTLRHEMAEKALHDVCKWFENEKGDIAIFDATNTTRKRRKFIINYLENFDKSLNIIFIESICKNETIINENILAVKLNSADYAQNIKIPPDKIVSDFKHRIEHYKDVYEPLDPIYDKDLSYICIYEQGKQFFINNIEHIIPSRICYFIMNIRVIPNKVIYLTRHGESMMNRENRLGGDSALSPNGQKYSLELAKYFNNAQFQPLQIWSSTLRRAIETVQPIAGFSKKYFRSLNELNMGVCENMTYKEIEEKYPHVATNRKINKFVYRYPNGESY
ncbi:hypothetical protein A3Q56_07270, partial [Intoshia linei]